MESASLAHERLKMELRVRNSSMSKIAAALGVSPGAVTNVSLGIRRSRRIERALAEAVGLSVATLFPDRYGKEDGK
ncbi:helix-turn-helix domain-containing protein [Ruegeria sp. 2012CJ41-6]|uniref:Helix-turn-helix domain-containing protein n=1 Tax=Ruegeria spongiae TaxID=2942209 RepID=A0ABT0Q797_9RHOB|nr:helix-turn-helix domain-containing protein [Ruegeria spongiae]MCL6285741.1 helix-turn-helix domain-containing protein [Ruegeria spongiae]